MSTTITVTGNLTREPEIAYTRQGHARALLGLAVNERHGSSSEETTSFFEVVCWRELGENVVLSLMKGARVIVTGRLQQRSWLTKSGEQRFTVEIVATDVGPSLCFATAEPVRNERRVTTAEPVEEVHTA